MTTTNHRDHDVWPLISEPGRVWCRTCREHYRATVAELAAAGRHAPASWLAAELEHEGAAR